MTHCALPVASDGRPRTQLPRTTDLFEHVPHLNVLRAPPVSALRLEPQTSRPAATLLTHSGSVMLRQPPHEIEAALAADEVRVHALQRPEKTRWGLLLRVLLPGRRGGCSGGGEGEGEVRLRFLAEARPLAAAACFCMGQLTRRLLVAPDAAHLSAVRCADEAISLAMRAAAQVRAAAARVPPSNGQEGLTALNLSSARPISPDLAYPPGRGRRTPSCGLSWSNGSGAGTSTTQGWSSSATSSAASCCGAAHARYLSRSSISSRSGASSRRTLCHRRRCST